MTKEAIVAEFKANGEFTRTSHSFTQTWDHAFKLYIAATGDRSISHKCGSCYKKVMKWLQS